MSDKNKSSISSGEKSKSSKKRKIKKKDRGLLPFITTPIIFVLISLVVILPMFIAFTDFAVDKVHEAQQSLVMDYYDKEISTERFDNKTLDYEASIGACEKVGVIKCEDAGIEADVFYGINRVSLRNGAGISSKSTFSGYSSQLTVAGYSTRAFKGLNNVSEGDKIIFETTEKIYEYTVISNSVTNTPARLYGGNIVLCSDENSKAFSAFNSEKRYVVASFSSMKMKEG